MDIIIDEQFDINNEEWTIGKCKQFLRFVQKNPTDTPIKKEPDDENHLFLPKYLTLTKDKAFYEWKPKNLENIFVAIFRFLHKHYPEVNRMRLGTKHDEKRNEWNIEYQKYLKDKNKKKEAKMQDQVIREVNDRWLPGFKYLYDFEYQHGDHKGDLIFANDYGILAAVETKRGGYIKRFIPKKRKEAERQAIKYRNLLMEETENDPRIITVFGVYVIELVSGLYKKNIPSNIDYKIWKAIEKVNKANNFNNNSPESDQMTIAQTIGNETFDGLLFDEDGADSADDVDDQEITDNLNKLSLTEKN